MLLPGLVWIPAALAWDGGQVQVDEWTSRDGLPQNTVTDIVQTSDGYVWMTTFGGIARFDGVRFHVFDPASAPSLPTTRFVSIAEAADGGLWLGTESSGVVRMDADHHFEAVGPDGVGVVWDLDVGPDGSVWAASHTGVYRSTPDADTFVRVDERSSRRLFRRADGSLWASTDRGVTCLQGACPADPPPIRHGGVAETSDGALVIVTPFGLRRWEDPGWSALEGSEGAGWGAPPVFWNGALWRVSEKALIRLEGEPREYPLSLRSDDGVRAAVEDREGGLWVGLTGGGLARIRASGVERVTQASQAIVPGPDASVVVFACRDVRVVKGDLTLPDLSEFCGSGAFEANGSLWRLGDEAEEYLLARSDGAASEVVSRPARSKANAIVEGPWISLSDGVYRVVDGELTRVVTPSDLGEDWVRVVRRHGEAVWARGGSGALFRVQDDGEWSEVASLDVAATVRDVVPSDTGAWVATYGGGLHWVGEGAARRVSMSTGLCDDSVSRLLPVGRHLWLNTNRGVGRVAFAELDRFRAGDIDTITCELLDSGEANGGGGMVGVDGLLYLPTIHGAVVVDPADALPPAVAPIVRIEESTFGQRRLQDGAVFKGGSDLAIDYTGLSFDDPIGVRFRHRLLGHDGMWTPLSSNRQVRFVDLAPGEYRFEVQARSARGVWSDVASLSFKRQSEWYETWFARFVLPLLVLAVVLIALIQRVRRTTAQNEELRSEVEQRHRAETKLREQQAVNERAARELARARRLEALGRLAGGVAHDFNNLLSVILGRMDLLRDHGDPKVVADAQVASTAAERASALTAQLLAFGKRADDSPQVLDLALVVEELRDLLDELLGERVSLALDLQAGLRVRMDRTRLEQTLTNLCVNARDAISDYGRVEIRISSVEGVHDGRAGTWAMLRVRDDGEGIAPDVVEQMFDPYFTTKAPGQGLGLGLATVHGVVQEANGTIQVDSEPGAGTTFSIRIPLVDDPPLQTHRQRDIETSIAGVRVLLVDDDDDVRKTVALQLGLRGADVQATGSPQEALSAAAEAPFDILVTDVLMPAMSGAELAERMQENAPLPVLYISGHTGDALGFDASAVVLRKPFTSEVLASAVLELLARQ